MSENTFIIIPPHICADRNLSPSEKLVFGQINGLTSKHGYCFATNGYIADQIGLSDSMVSKHISKLEKKGYLRLEITKIKKDERTGLAGEKYGTIRHIYVYQKVDMENPSTINGAPPSTINGESIVKKHKKERVSTPPQMENGYQWMQFPLKEQIKLLRSVMTITGFTDANATAMVSRLTKSAGENKIETAYAWLYDDVVNGKLTANYFDFTSSGGGVVNNMPESFEKACELMQERIGAIEEQNPGFIAGKQVEVPDANNF